MKWVSSVRQTDRQTDRGRQVDRQTEAGRQADRQKDRHVHGNGETLANDSW